MQKTLIGATIAVAGIFGIGFTVGQIGGITASSAATHTSARAAAVRPHGLPHGLRPQAGGKVTAISGDTITVKPDAHLGSATTIVVSSATKFEAGPNKSSTLSAIKVGSFVGAEGTLSSDGTILTATAVQVFDSHGPMGPGGPIGGPYNLGPHADGKVTAVSGNMITITPDADTHTGPSSEYKSVTTITVTDSTKYDAGPGQTATLSAIKVGSFVVATGTVSSDGTSLAATHIMVPNHFGMGLAPRGAPNGALPSGRPRGAMPGGFAAGPPGWR